MGVSKSKALKAASVPMLTLGYIGVAGGITFMILGIAEDDWLAIGCIPTGSTAAVFLPIGHVLYARARGSSSGKMAINDDLKYEFGLTFNF